MIDLFFGGLSFSISVFSVIFGLIAFIKVKSLIVRYFSISTIFSGIKGFFYAMYISGYLGHFPWLYPFYGWSTIGTFLHMPIATFAMLSVVYPEFKPKGLSLSAYFVPTVIRTLTLIPFLSLPAETRYQILTDSIFIRHPDDIPGTFNFPPIQLMGMFFLGLCIYHYHINISWKDISSSIRNKRWPKNLLFYLYLVLWVQIVFLLIHDYTFKYGFRIFFLSSILVMQFNILLFNIILALYPSLLHLGILNKGDKFSVNKYLKSKLKGIDLLVLQKSLHKLIEEEQIFLDENLRLEGLAKKMNVTTHQLSEYFNKILNESFTNYINRHRVEYAIEQMKSGNQNLLMIALDSGFNSYSSFYSIYREITGHSPRKHQKYLQSSDTAD